MWVLDSFIFYIVDYLDKSSESDKEPDDYFSAPFDPKILKDIPRVVTTNIGADI